MTENTIPSHLQKLVDQVPEDEGWYWLREGGEWHIAHVSIEGNQILVYDRTPAGPGPCGGSPRVYSADGANWTAHPEYLLDFHPMRWRGPINCPSESATVIPQEIVRLAAKRSGHATVIQYADFSTCGDDKSGARVTVEGYYSREEAMRLVSAINSPERRRIDAVPALIKAVQAMLEDYEEGKSMPCYEVREMCRAALKEAGVR